MKKTTSLIILLISFSALLSAERPYWWDSPHQDDEAFMYEKGASTDGIDEQDAVKKAVRSAKSVLIERIGIAGALTDAGLEVPPEYALVNCGISGTTTEKKGGSWCAWVLVKYSQEEKAKMLERWNASISGIKGLKAREEKIPVQFGISFATRDGRKTYRAKEEVSFLLTAERDAYLLIIDHQSDGSSVILFPNRFHPDCYVGKGERVMIPSPSTDDFKLVVGEPFGDDRLEAIAATTKSALHEKYSSLVKTLTSGQNFAVAPRVQFEESIDSQFELPGDAKTLWSRAELNISTYAE